MRVRTMRTSEAAAYLNVSPNTLRAWEQRFGFPRPERSPGHHRHYAFAELVALRESLSNGLAVSSAVSAARDATAADEHTLTAALLNFDYVRADRAMELGLSLRTFESAVMQVLVPALQEIETKTGLESAPWAFASRWAAEWIARAERLASTPDDRPAVLFADCSGERPNLDGMLTRVLEVFCVRAGVAALPLPVDAHCALERAVRIFAPRVLVLAGRGARDDQVVNFESVVRRRAPRVACVRFRRHGRADDSPDVLSPSPLQARDEIVAIVARGPLRHTRAD
jgi:hypothetical protein